MSYLLISLPQSVGQSTQISNWVDKNANNGHVETYKQGFPSFKVGTLDSLVLQIEELTKFDHQLFTSVSKVLDIQGQLDLPSINLENQLLNFKWNQNRFKIDKPIGELINLISNEALQLDSDLRSQFQTYNNAKSNLLSVQRKQIGDLSVKSLHDVVSKSDFVIGSDHLKTVLLAVPIAQKSQFENSYETLTDFVVPRSANQIAIDSEFVLYGVTLFKKFESQFIAKAREMKWIPREFDYSDEIIENLRSEFDLVKKEELTLRNDLIRFVNVAYNDISMCWIHIKFLRAFVESVLRYGLPPIFNCFILKVPNDSNDKGIDKAKSDLIAKFGYLSGQSSNDNNDSSLHDYANLVDTDYEPFVLYKLQLQ